MNRWKGRRIVSAKVKSNLARDRRLLRRLCWWRAKNCLVAFSFQLSLSSFS